MYVDRDENDNIVALYGMPQRENHEYAEGAELHQAPQTIRDSRLQAMEYDLGDGRVIQVRPQDEQNVQGAIALGVSPVGWRMKDNSVQSVTAAELQSALSSGRQQAMAIWHDYNNG